MVANRTAAIPGSVTGKQGRKVQRNSWEAEKPVPELNLAAEPEVTLKDQDNELTNASEDFVMQNYVEIRLNLSSK